MSSNSKATHIYAVYRIEGEVAILVGEELDEVAVPLSDLPDPISEETVLLVPRHADGTPVWRTAVIDEESDDRRRAEEAEALLVRIREWQAEQKEVKEGVKKEEETEGEETAS